MCDKFNGIFIIKDTQSNKYLNNIWLTENMDKATKFTSKKAAEKHISRIRIGKFTSNGITGVFADNLIVVNLTK